MEYSYISERELTSQRPEGGLVTAAEIVQNDDAKWYLVVSVSWRSGPKYVVTKFTDCDIKYYILAFGALRHVIGKYGYVGPIILHPQPGMLPDRYI
jgi:hypothetical protein